MIKEQTVSRHDPGLHDLYAVVTLKAALETAKGSLPAGARGVVHERKDDGSRYLVEFVEPFFCVVELPGEALRRA